MLDKEVWESMVGKFIAVTTLFFIVFLYSFVFKSEKAKKWAAITNYLITLFVIMAAYSIPYLMKENYKPWNDKETTQFKTRFISEIRKADYPLFPSQEYQVTECILEKIKTKYPKGGQSDTLGMHAFAYKAGKDCISKLTENAKLNGWTESFEKGMFDQFYNNPDMIKIYKNDQQRTKAAGCCLAKLKSTYPNGIDFKDLKSKIDTIYRDCF
jgi:hypothetical protein